MDKNNENEVTKEDESRMGALRDQLKQNKEKEIKIFEQRRKLENEHKAYTASIEDAHSQFKKKHEELMNVREALRSVEIQEEQLDLQKKELSVDFNAWVGSVKPSGDPISSSEGVDMRKKIERMRIKLEDAGGLDDSVVKEFEETQKRDSFLALELDDLKKTQNSLTELFVDLETQIARDFETGISKINVLFGEFFKEIFGGGKAMLKILKPKKHSSQNDDEDFEVEIEEEGLDISVDIPRKRIRSLAMLSGGERALTSIALLFAVSAVNPPPFLVLDETDAALDEANSTRYSRMLKDLSKKTQLVVITHNRETMRIAQVLYGVTMGGEGVSKLLSVQLEEAEEMIN